MPRNVGEYELVRHLGGGGQAFVARDREGKERVVALLDVRGAQRARVREEVARCDALKHRAIVAASTLLDDQGDLVLVFDRVPGVSLGHMGRQLEREGERLADVAVWHIAHEIAAALRVAHASAGGAIVHGCLAPRYVTITWDANVRILGFGASSAFHPAGAGAFAPPEARQGAKLTPASNVYALGAIVWWLAAGKWPPESGPKASLATLRPDYPKELAELVDCALRLPHARRRVTAADFVDAFGSEAMVGRRELRWNVDVLRGAHPMDEIPPSSGVGLGEESPASSDQEPTHIHTLPEPVAEPTPPPPAAEPRRGRPRRRTTLQSERWDDDSAPPASTQVAANVAEKEAEFLHAVPAALEVSPRLAPESSELATVATVEPTPTPRPPESSPEPQRVTSEPTVSPTIQPARRRRRAWPLVLVLSSAAAALALGAWMNRGRLPTDWLRGDTSTPPQEPASSAGEAPATVDERVSAPDPQPSATEPSATEPSASRSAAEPSPSASVDVSADRPPPGHGFIVVPSDVEGAGVYIFGKLVGPANQRIAVPCRRAHVRVGSIPRKRWFSEGRSLHIPCGVETRIELPAERGP